MTDNVLDKPLILHPTDFSEDSITAFHHALKLALAKRTGLYILHVNLPGSGPVQWEDYPPVRETLSSWGIVDDSIARDELFDSCSIFVDKVEVRGDSVANAIIRFSQLHRRGIDTIVTNTGARQGLPRWLHPSIAEQLTRDLSIPTLFVPNTARVWVDSDTGDTSLDQILVPVDSKPDPGLAIQNAQALLNLFKTSLSTVTPIHVGTQFDFTHLELEDDTHCHFNPSLVSGNTVDSIINTANVLKAKMIVMATQGHQGILDVIRGSVSERVLRAAPCSVFVIPTTPAKQVV